MKLVMPLACLLALALQTNAQLPASEMADSGTEAAGQLDGAGDKTVDKATDSTMKEVDDLGDTGGKAAEEVTSAVSDVVPDAKTIGQVTGVDGKVVEQVSDTGSNLASSLNGNGHKFLWDKGGIQRWISVS